MTGKKLSPEPHASFPKILYSPNIRRRILPGFYLAAVYAVLLSKIDIRLLFTDTILTGGDSASWLQPLVHLKEYLIPHFRLSGWTLSKFLRLRGVPALFYCAVPHRRHLQPVLPDYGRIEARYHDGKFSPTDRVFYLRRKNY